jgi:NADH dehydrogenase (ubiquinone) 1 alpha subcomplex subunit 5
MRAAARLFASVKPGQFLEAGAPTGLTGLLTHPSPRSSLIYFYTTTLDKLKQIPESSVYRQSTEALTKHRLQIVEQSKPAGWDEWQATIEDGEKVQSFPEGIRSSKERLPHVKAMKGDANYKPERVFSKTEFAPEPQYTTDA